MANHTHARSRTCLHLLPLRVEGVLLGLLALRQHLRQRLVGRRGAVINVEPASLLDLLQLTLRGVRLVVLR